MDMTLRPGEALVWRWDRREPVKYHGRSKLDVFKGGKTDAALFFPHSVEGMNAASDHAKALLVP